MHIGMALYLASKEIELNQGLHLCFPNFNIPSYKPADI